MPTIKIILITCIQLLSLFAIGYLGPILGFVLAVAGFVPIEEIGRWPSYVAYVYFPLNGLLFATGAIFLIVEAEAINPQLTLTGKEFGFKILKLWRAQNILTALLCICVYALSSAYSIGFYRGLFEHLRR